MRGNTLDKKMDHLTCFVPGMLALGVHHNIVTGEKRDKHLQVCGLL